MAQIIKKLAPGRVASWPKMCVRPRNKCFLKGASIRGIVV